MQTYWDTSFPYDAKYEDCARHNKGANIGFADGHVKFLPSGRIRNGLCGVR